MEVGALALPVASIDDVLVAKLLAISEQDELPAGDRARSRAPGQIDWEFVRLRTGDSPFARAFFTLVEGLGIVEASSLTA